MSDRDPKDPTGTITRRGWLRKLGLGAGAAAATAAAASCKKGWTPRGDDPFSKAMAKPYVPGANDYGRYEERWFKTSCAQCSAGCGIHVRVVEGRAVRVEGNPDNPVNKGGIGPRGLSTLQALYDSKRIKQPLERVGGKLVPISWQDATKKLVSWLGEVRKSGPDKLLVMTGMERGFTHELFERFCRAYGTPNFVDGRPSHSGVLAQAMKAVMNGSESPAYGWFGAHTVLSLESALIENSCQSVYFARVAAALRRGDRGHRAKIVHAGAMFDLAAYNADQWLRIEPGTGGALALGLSRVLVDHFKAHEKLDAESFVNTAEFRAFVKDYTVKSVAKITGLEPRQITRLAADIWANRPAFVLVDERSTSFSNGFDTAAAAFGLNALLGAVEAPAGGMRVSPHPDYADWPVFSIDSVATAGLARPRLDGAGTNGYPLAGSIHETLPEAIEKTPPGMALIHYTDPVHSRIQPERWRKALAKIPHVVSFSPYLEGTVASVATLVLPDHTPMERWEDAASAPALARAVAGVRRPVIKPLLDTRATTDVLIDAAQTLGGGVATAFPWKSFHNAIQDRWAGLQKLERGSIVANSERSFVRAIEDRGVWYEATDAAVQPVTFRFHTAYQLPQWAGDEEKYPFKLLAYRDLTDAVGGPNMPWLRMLQNRTNVLPWEHSVFFNPEDAPDIGDGDKVTVTSNWGSATLIGRREPRMRRGCLAISIGRGRNNRHEVDGINVMKLLHPGPAPRSGASVFCGTRARLDKGAA